MKLRESMEPKVTVVTIVYNLLKAKREKTFRQCIESVHKQTYKNIEHIVIDGASTDGTLELIQEYVDKGWVTCYSEPDNGIYDAINKGIAKATGKYFAVLNSDDFYHNPNGIKQTVKLLEEQDADYCIGDVIGVDNNNENNKAVWKGRLELLYLGCGYCHQSMLIKTEILREYGGFDTNYKICADSDLMIHLYCDKKKVIVNPVCFASYRSGGISCTDRELCRKEHSSVYYKYAGKDIGLTEQDCYNLWNFCCLYELDENQMNSLLKKVKNEPYYQELYKRFKKFDVKYFKIILFGLIPIGKIKKMKNKLKFLLFNFIPVYYYKENPDKFREWRILGIPVLKIKVK